MITHFHQHYSLREDSYREYEAPVSCMLGLKETDMQEFPVRTLQSRGGTPPKTGPYGPAASAQTAVWWRSGKITKSSGLAKVFAQKKRPLGFLERGCEQHWYSGMVKIGCCVKINKGCKLPSFRKGK